MRNCKNKSVKAKKKRKREVISGVVERKDSKRLMDRRIKIKNWQGYGVTEGGNESDSTE